jgi:hypothetical protein
MSRSSKVEQAQRRAVRLSLRTFRRAPNVVGETTTGEPIVELGTVKLTLPENSAHFRRIVPCSRCERETLGGSVTSTAELRDVESNVLCDDCARSSLEVPLTLPNRRDRGEPAGHPVEGLSPFDGGGEGVEQSLVASEREAEAPYGREPATAGRSGRSEGGIDGLLAQYHDLVVATLGRRLHTGLQRWGTALVEGFDARAREVASEMGRVVGARAEQQGAELVTRLVSALGSRLDEHGQALTQALEERHLRLISGLADAVGVRMNEQAEALATELDERQRQLAAELGEAIGRRQAELVSALRTAWDQGLARHAESLVAGLDERQRELASAVGVEFGQRLEQHAESVVSALEHRQAELVSEAAAELGERLEQQARALTSALDNRQRELVSEVAAEFGTLLEQQVQVLSSALEQRQRELVLELGTDVGKRLDQHAEAMVARLDQRQADLVAELESAVSQRLRQQAEALAAGLDRLHSAMSELAGGQLVLSELRPAIDQLDGRLWEWANQLERTLAQREARAAAPVATEIAITDFVGTTELLERLPSVAQVDLQREEGLTRADLMGLSADVAKLQKEVSATRRAVAELRRAVRPSDGGGPVVPEDATPARPSRKALPNTGRSRQDTVPAKSAGRTPAEAKSSRTGVTGAARKAPKATAKKAVRVQGRRGQ